jgi:Protein of unknown function (DUF2971)
VAVKLQTIFRTNPGVALVVKEALKKDPARNGLNLDYWKTRSEAFVKETNEFMQGYRVLCVTTEKASERMWRDYAQDHQGIALRITPSVEKDSKFLMFAPVTYPKKRPAIYANTLDFAKETLFGDRAARARSIMDRIIYAKTDDYDFESEYRLAIPLGEGEEDYRTLPYLPEEITELYLGTAMTNADKQDVVAKAKALNPKITVFQAKRNSSGGLVFERS